MDVGISNQQADPSSSVASQPVAGPGSSVMARLLADEAEMEEGEIDELLSVQASDQAPSQRNLGVSTDFVSQPEPHRLSPDQAPSQCNSGVSTNFVFAA